MHFHALTSASSSQRFRALIPSILIASTLALAACGGGGGGGGGSGSAASAQAGGASGNNQPAAAASAPTSNATPLSVNPDRFSVDWKGATDLDVTANDTGANAAGATLSIASAPAHGTASVNGGTIRYQPAAAYIGPDSLTYTVRNGSEAHTGQVDIEVKAQLQLSGTTSPASAGATVTLASAGTVLATATADAAGAYTLPVTLSQPDAMLELQSAGTGRQSPVYLRSLLGSAASLAAAGASTGAVAPAVRTELALSPVSTAVAELIRSSLGGSPKTDAELLRASEQTSLTDIDDAARAITMVTELGRPLPAGVNDTATLVTTTHAVLSVHQAFNAADALAYATALSASFSRGSVPELTTPPQAAVAITLVDSQAVGISPATRFTLNANGTAILNDPNRASATWRVDAGLLTVVPDQPALIAFEQPNTEIDPDTGLPVRSRVTPTSYTVTQLNRSVFQVERTERVDILEGSQAGSSRTQKTARIFHRVSTTSSFAAGEVQGSPTYVGTITPSASWSDANFVVDGSSGLSFASNGQSASLTSVPTTTASVTLDGGTLVVSYASEQHRARKLQLNQWGDERWLVEVVRNGDVQWVATALVVKMGTVPTLSLADFVGRWTSSFQNSANGSYWDFVIDDKGVTTPIYEFAAAQGQNPPSLASVSSTTPTSLTQARYRAGSGQSGFCAPTNAACVAQGTIASTVTWRVLARVGNDLYIEDVRATAPSVGQAPVAYLRRVTHIRRK